MILKKVSKPTQAIVGDTITYTLTATNDDTFNYTSVTLKDLLSPDLSFVDGSVQVDGVALPTASILTGVDIGSLVASGTKVLEFKAKILSKSGATIDNTSTAYYTHLNTDGQSVINTVDSNKASVEVYIADLKVTKLADKKSVSLTDVVTYYVVVENIGDIDTYSVNFIDMIPPSLSVIPGSFKVNGVVVNDVNLTQGVDIGAIPVGGRITLQYQAIVTGGSCSGFICNDAYVLYDYVQPNAVTGKKSSSHASLCLESRITSFKQLILDKYCEVPCTKPDIEDLNDEVTVDIEIDNSYVIETLNTSSIAGQNLTGYKLIIHGSMYISIEYTACLDTQPVHSYHCELPFGTFVILPPDYTMGQQVEVNAIVENVEADMACSRGVFTNVTLLFVARVN